MLLTCDFSSFENLLEIHFQYPDSLSMLEQSYGWTYDVMECSAFVKYALIDAVALYTSSLKSIMLITLPVPFDRLNSLIILFSVYI